MVDSMLINAPIVCESSLFCPCFLTSAWCPFWFCNHLHREEKADCFA